VNSRESSSSSYVSTSEDGVTWWLGQINAAQGLSYVSTSESGVVIVSGTNKGCVRVNLKSPMIVLTPKECTTP
jgi:hypothetical protein